MNSIPKSTSVFVRSTAVFPARFVASTTGFFLSILFVLGTACAVHGQNIAANAQISGQPAGGGVFDYTITLNNSSNSSSQVETFWFSWVPGEDFMPTNPISVLAPAGWTYSVVNGSYYGPDGYSIEFNTGSAPLNPGASLNFKFTSLASPTALAGDSPFYPGNPVDTAYLYSSYAFYGASEQLVVESVPEPSCLSLLAVGLTCLLAAGWRTRRVSGLSP
jgi:hypothetical protein